MKLTLSQPVKASAINWMSAGFNIYGAYDLATSTLPRKIFDPRKAPLGEETPFGRLPAYLTFRPIKTSDFFYASGDGRDSFQSNFAARASVDVSVGAFSGHVEAAYGRQVAESSQYSFANVSFREMLGNLVLEGLADTKYLSDEFTAAVQALPAQATASNLDQFSDFFETFGAYFVSQITVGGTLEYYVAVHQSSSMQATEIQAKAEAEYKGLFVKGKASAEMSSDQRWETYRKNKTATIRIKGGGDVERDLLNKIDSSLDSMTQATVDRYDAWLRTVATDPAVMDFRLTGVWEVCGAKRRAVQDAFREYGRLMRPLLRIETRTVVDRGDTYTPGVFLGGSLVPADASQTPYQGWGGYRLVIIDRKRPSIAGVRLSKLYNVDTGDSTGYKKVFDTMLKDLRAGGFVDNRDSFVDHRYFFVLATYGTLNSFPPVPSFIRLLQEAGAGTQLGAWLESASRGVGTSSISADVSYILVGIMKSGPDAGVEALGLYPIQGFPRTPHTSKLDVYFYGLGAGHPYVLGPAERKSLRAAA